MSKIIGIGLLRLLSLARFFNAGGKAVGSGVVLRLFQCREFQPDLRARLAGTVPSGKRVFDGRFIWHKFQHPALGFGSAR